MSHNGSIVFLFELFYEEGPLQPLPVSSLDKDLCEETPF